MIEIKTGLMKMGVPFTEDQLDQLEEMLLLLNQWNQKHNLTRYKSRQDQIIYHIFDSLSAYQCFSPYKVILDVGTGAGFPGIPLAILYPEKTFHLVDANGKKIAYLKLLIKTLSLKNVHVYHDRMENLQIKGIEVVTARALASPSVIKSWVSHLGDALTYILYVGKNISKGVNIVNVPGSEKTHGILIC